MCDLRIVVNIELVSGNDDDYRTPELKVYPNPVFKGEIVTFGFGCQELSIKEFELFNSHGHKINTQILDLKNDTYQLDTKKLSLGIYVLHHKNFKKGIRFIVLGP